MSEEGRVSAPRGFALTVDVEDYFQVWAFSDCIERRDWDRFPRRVGEATRRTLDLFDRCGVKATFFVLGWVAEREPAIIREIAARGHEVASHGYDHRKLFEQGADEFREDVLRARKLIEDASGAPVIGYRAPGFSLDARAPFAHEILRETGHRYSSSTHPIRHDHYGDPAGPRAPFKPLAGDDFLEVPVATAALLGRRFSCAGGGWFRAAPYFLSQRLLALAEKQIDGPVVFYFHPWELDCGQPRVEGARLKSRLRHYLNLSQMEGKLERLARARPWTRLDAALGLEMMRAAA